MTPVEHPAEIEERQTTIAQERPQGELPRTAPLIPPASTMETRREEPPLDTPPAPPGTPPVAQRWRPSGGRWAWSIALVVLGGLAWWIYGFILGTVGFSIGGGRDVFSILISTLVAAVPALTCLVAGWLLRSWSGMIVAAVVYVAASAAMWVLAAVGDLVTAEFALYVVMPAIVMGAIGAAIGISRAR